MLKSIPPEEKKTYVTLYRTNGYSYTLNAPGDHCRVCICHHDFGFDAR